MVGREGFEPSTNWLKANCSTTELTTRPMARNDTTYSSSCKIFCVKNYSTGQIKANDEIYINADKVSDRPRLPLQSPDGASDSYHTCRRLCPAHRPDSKTR